MNERREKIITTARLLERGTSTAVIASQVHAGKDLISTVRKYMAEQKMDAETISSMTNEQMDMAFPPKKRPPSERETIYREPDYEYCEKELMKQGVTKQVLWEEYRDECEIMGAMPYQLTQFKKHLNDHINTQPYAALLTHKPGMLIEVDWTGDKACWKDPATGKNVYGWLFVGVLSFSGLCFAKVYRNMKEAVWTKAHVEMFHYFRGTTPTLRCDNLRTGIDRHLPAGEYVVQKDYQALAKHYAIVVVPGKPADPKSKPLVENTVKNCEQRLLAALRNETLYSIDEYNGKLAEKLEQFNNMPFQKREGSRRSVYEKYEKEYLLPLPAHDYEYSEVKTTTVQGDNFITYDKNFYSVPRKPKTQVTVYGYEDRVEIYDGLDQLAVFPRVPSGCWKKSYNPAHFSNTNHGEWSKERFLRWARNIGPYTYEVTDRIFLNGPEQVYYRSVQSLLKLADVYTRERLENTCRILLGKKDRPTYQLVKAYLANEQDLADSSDPNRKENSNEKRKELSYLEVKLDDNKQ